MNIDPFASYSRGALDWLSRCLCSLDQLGKVYALSATSLLSLFVALMQ